MAGRERVVNLRIKAQDDYSAQIRRARDALKALSDTQAANTAAGIQQTARARQEVEKLRQAYQTAAEKMMQASKVSPLSAGGPNPQTAGVSSAGVNQLRTLQAQVKATREEYDRMRASTGALGAAIAKTATPTEQMKIDFDRAKKSLADLRLEMQRQQAQLAKFRQANSQGFRGFMQRTGPSPMMPGGPAGATGGSWWQKFTGGVNSSLQTAHGRGPLGLRPYELTNLGYQLNDLATQMASGTSFAQAFAQQIGQIAQIFPSATGAILRFSPVLAGLAAVVVPVIAAFGRLREEMRLTTEFSGRLFATVDAKAYNPAALTQLVRDLERVGVAAEDSKAAILTMIGDGISTGRMEQFITIARDVSRVWGTDFADSLKTVREGFDGTYESVAKLDDQFNFLTAAQRDTIREMYAQGDAAEATSEAIDTFAERQNAAAELMRGNWSEAAGNLSVAWQDLLNYIGSTGPIQGAISAINALAGVVSRLTAQLAGLDAKAAATQGRIARLLTFGPAMNAFAMLMRPPSAPVEAPSEHRDDGLIGGSAPNVSQAQLKAESEARAKIKAEAEKAAAEEAMKAWAEYTRSEDQAREDLAEMNRRRREEEAEAQTKLAEDQAAALAKLDEETADRRFDARIATLGEREQKIQSAIREGEQELAKVGLSMDEKTKQDIIETTGLLYDQEQAAIAANKARSGGGGGGKAKTSEDIQNEKQKALEEALNVLLERRKALLEQIEFHEERGENSQAEQLEGQVGGLNTEIVKAIENLRVFWKGIGGPEADTALVKLDLVRQSLTDVGDEAVTTGKEMNEMLADGLSDGILDITDRMAEGESAIEALGNSFREFAADFLREIAKMILQQAILNALQAGGGASGGVGGVIAGAIGKLFHSGGVVGGPGASRRVPAAIFAGAPRLHGGGIAGLRAGEVPAILKRGEVVDPGDGSVFGKTFGQKPANFKIINTFEPADMLSKAMATEAGEQVFVNWVTRNRRKIKAAIG